MAVPGSSTESGRPSKSARTAAHCSVTSNTATVTRGDASSAAVSDASAPPTSMDGSPDVHSTSDAVAGWVARKDLMDSSGTRVSVPDQYMWYCTVPVV